MTITPKIIRDLKINTIGFVDKGANGASPVLIWKRLDEEAQDMTLDAKILKALEDIHKAVTSKAEGDVTDSPEKLLEQALADLPDNKKKAIMAAIAALYRTEPPKPEPAKPEQAPESEVVAASEASSEGDKKPEPDVGKVLKGLPAEAKSWISKLDTERRALAERVEKAERLVAQHEANARHAEMVELVKSMPFIPGDTEEMVTSLLALKSASQHGFDAMVKKLKSVNEVLKGSKIYTGVGSTREGGDDAASRVAEMTSKRMAEKNEPYEVAYTNILKAHPDLYDEIRKGGN